MRAGDPRCACNGEGCDGLGGVSGVETAGDAETVVDKDFDDGVVDEDLKGCPGREALGDFDLYFIETDGERVLMVVGTDFEDGAGGVGEGVRGGGAGGVEDAGKLLSRVGEVGWVGVGGGAEALGLDGWLHVEVAVFEGEAAG